MNLPREIIYQNQYQKSKFDIERFKKSISKYGEYDNKKLIDLLDKFSRYPMLHYSCLIEIGTQVLENDEDAKNYLNDHYSDSGCFERLRRITGYLVGSLERWNDGKRAEENDRVKHSI